MLDDLMQLPALRALVLFVAMCVSRVAIDAAELPPIADGQFTVLIIPDTQHYQGPGTKIEQRGITYHPGMKQHPYVRAHQNVLAALPTDVVNNGYLAQHIDWILEHKGDQKIVFVSHVGDIVEINRREEWDVAKSHLDRLRGVVPFGLGVGNHDMENNGNASLFQAAFPASSFADFAWYAGHYQHDRADQRVSANNVNSVQQFSAGGIDFVFLHLECNAPDDVVAWANSVLRDNADRIALITTHMDLGVRDKPTTQDGFIHDPQGRMRWTKIHKKRGNSAEQLRDKLYRKHANLRLVFSGDQSRVTAIRETRVGDNGNPVHSLLSDYGSLGAIRLVRFTPQRNQIDVITYDTMLEQLVESMPYAVDRDNHQFSLDVDLEP